MKGQATMEELLSLAIYLALLSLLISAVFSFKAYGEEWGDSLSLRTNAFSRARAYDSFSNSNLPYPDSWEGGGRGYIEISKGGEDGAIALPVLRGIADNAEGEPI